MRQKKSRRGVNARITKYVFVLVLSLTLAMGMMIPSDAHDVPNLGKKGTITVIMKCGDDVVAGGTLTAYRIGDIVENDGNFDFKLNGDFEESNVSLDGAALQEGAKELAAYAKTKGMEGKTETIGNDGEVKFEELEPALYLLVQNKAAEGYYAAEPFTVSLPSNEDGMYIYDVDATPKVELKKEPAAPPPGPLPQTGQLNWPIPVLAISGVLLFALGWLLRYDKKANN